MMKNKKINQSKIAAAYVVIIMFAMSVTPVSATLSGFNIQSIGSQGGTGTGFVEWDDAIASDTSLSGSGFNGVTQFNWSLTGGIYNGFNLNLADLNDIEWDSLSNGLATDFGFSANKGGVQVTSAGTLVSFVTGSFVAEGFSHTITPATVPIPGAILFFGSALIGLFGFRHRHRNGKSFAFAKQSYTNDFSI